MRPILTLVLCLAVHVLAAPAPEERLRTTYPQAEVNLRGMHPNNAEKVAACAEKVGKQWPWLRSRLLRLEAHNRGWYGRTLAYSFQFPGGPGRYGMDFRLTYWREDRGNDAYRWTYHEFGHQLSYLIQENAPRKMLHRWHNLRGGYGGGPVDREEEWADACRDLWLGRDRPDERRFLTEFKAYLRRKQPIPREVTPDPTGEASELPGV